ncbi:PRC-barrel domain-containing protein [Methylobacterium sp. SyP6R]|uniref:PRC-barrel domain-containing protein n=1 Tax=Methylobacterium sp. SyP6R TaxID=2718876 RepID=UPI001F45721D|nr:PRC-barrel domain-containing protein [Methylobacterium sp. SyP6R]MCF4129282.1 PRC-barrel domain-containing protein [Methylobacterium sp. SyP6R]
MTLREARLPASLPGTLRMLLAACTLSAVTAAHAQQGSAPADAQKPPAAATSAPAPAAQAPVAQPQAPAAQPQAPAAQPQAPAAQAPANPAPAAQAPAVPHGTPATVLDTQDYDGVLGKPVRSAAGEDMGRIIDIIVDKDGKPRAAIIDFGGFLGVGSRKIAVDWRALHFSADNKPGRAVLQLNRNQVRVSPEYKPGDPIVVLGPAGPVPPPASSAAAAPASPAPAAPPVATPAAPPASPPAAAAPAPDADQAASRNPPDK